MAHVESRDDVLSRIYSFWYETLVNTPSKHDDNPMSVQCWPTICDTGPTSNQRWFNASCLLGCVQPSKHKTFVQCWTNVEDVVPTLYKCYTNVLCLLGIAAGLVLLAAYCWPRPSRPYVKCWVSIAGPHSAWHQTRHGNPIYWANVGSASYTVGQH